jgi:hypothetical protein
MNKIRKTLALRVLATALGLLLVTVPSAACDRFGSGSGSGGTGSGSGGGGGGGGGTGGNSGGGGAAPPKYSWNLPIGDVSPNESEKEVYELLARGDCAGAAAGLEAGKIWQKFSSPRDVLLAQAGIEFCRANVSAGTEWFRKAETYGWAGLLPDEGANEAHAACELYMSASSVIRQEPRSSFTCPRGLAPAWPTDTDASHVDPRR